MQDQNKLEKLSYRFKRVLLVLEVSQAKNKQKIKWFWHQQIFFFLLGLSVYCTHKENLEGWQFTAIPFKTECILFIFNAVLSINLWYKLDCGFRSRFLSYQFGTKKNLRFFMAKMTCEINFPQHTKWGSSHYLPEKWLQNLMMTDVDSNVFWCKWNACF